jgi:hypothetical protein
MNNIIAHTVVDVVANAAAVAAAAADETIGCANTKAKTADHAAQSSSCGKSPRHGPSRKR